MKLDVFSANYLATSNEIVQRANVAKTEYPDQFLFVSSCVDGWIIDSGATCHIVGNKEDFLEFNPSHREEIFVANGNQVEAIGKGTVGAKFLNEFGDERSVKIVDVLYVPSIKGNLISVKRLTDSGYVVNFDDRFCRISKGQVQVAIADINGNLYKLRTANTICAVENLSNDCIHKWHSVLGHRDIEVVKTLSLGKFVTGVQIQECTNDCETKLNCETCLQGKMSRMKFPQKSENRAREKLQHSDVCGKMQTPSPSGFKYVLTFIDDFTRYSVVFLLKGKS